MDNGKRLCLVTKFKLLLDIQLLNWKLLEACVDLDIWRKFEISVDDSRTVNSVYKIPKFEHWFHIAETIS